MNVLLIGDSGLIGKRLKNYLLKQDWNVIGMSLSKSDINFNGSLPLSSEVKDSLTKLEIDSIVFSAFKIPKSKDEDNDDLLLENLKIITCLKEIVNIVEPESIINLSSIAVYPNISGTYLESTMVNPSVNWNSYYGLSKLCSEQILSNLAIEKKINVAHLRITQLIDEEGNDLLQRSFEEEYKEKKQITVFADGERESNFIQLNYLCEVVEAVIIKKLSGIYNTGDVQINYLEVAKKYILNKGGDQSQIKLVSNGYKTKVIIDCSKLKKALGH